MSLAYIAARDMAMAAVAFFFVKEMKRRRGDDD